MLSPIPALHAHVHNVLAALATPTTTTRRPVDNGAVLGRRLTTAETLTMSRMARGEDPNKCLFLKDSNSVCQLLLIFICLSVSLSFVCVSLSQPLSPTSLTDQVQGIKFKATDALQGVTLQTCGDGRDCARLVKCSSPHPKICLEAQECFDPLGKNRCIELTECQCLQGSFSLANAPVGFRFEPANSIVDPGLDIPISEVTACFKIASPCLALISVALFSNSCRLCSSVRTALMERHSTCERVRPWKAAVSRLCHASRIPERTAKSLCQGAKHPKQPLLSRSCVLISSI